MVVDINSTLATLRGYLLTGNAQLKTERAAIWKDTEEGIAHFDDMAKQFTNPENKKA